MQDRTLPSKHAKIIAEAIEDLATLIVPLRKYAEEKAKEEAVNEIATKAQPLEAPSKTSQPLASETKQTETYRTLSTLTGMSPEDIERQLTKLKEALKELKTTR
jgi:hypothetical protein